eukprot:scaffold17829_cov30-Tisochrysis_lutea.AAC.2
MALPHGAQPLTARSLSRRIRTHNPRPRADGTAYDSMEGVAARSGEGQELGERPSAPQKRCSLGARNPGIAPGQAPRAVTWSALGKAHPARHRRDQRLEVHKYGCHPLAKALSPHRLTGQIPWRAHGIAAGPIGGEGCAKHAYRHQQDGDADQVRVDH